MSKGLLKQNGVHLKPHEYNTVRFLLDQGFDIELIPTSGIKGLRMPDIMMSGVAWEMKSPEGDGKYTIKNAIQNASHQSGNIIIDLRRTKIPQSRCLSEISRYFNYSKRIRRVKVITAEEKVIDFVK